MRPDAHRPPRRPGGFTLVEAILALAVLAIAAMGIVALLVQSARWSALTSDRSRAQSAARGVADDLLGRSILDAFARYNASLLDDPADPMENPVTNGPWGPDFDVEGLAPRPGDADGHVGRVVFPEVAGQVVEDAVEPALGMPRDLDGDGRVSARPVAGPRLLPVRILVEWARPGGPPSRYALDLVLVTR